MSEKGINSTGLARIVEILKANFARLSHTHAASDVTSGVFDAARIPVASSSDIGGIKVGTGLSIANDGTLSASGGGGSGGSASVMTGATDSSDGVGGLVPAPSSGEQNKVLFGDGDWGTLGLTKTTSTSGQTLTLSLTHGFAVLAQQTISTPTPTAPGLMSSDHYKKMIAIEAQATHTYKTLLWFNPDPTANFGSQTVDLGERAANYDFLLFEYMYSATSGYVMSQLTSADATSIALRVVQAGANRTGGRNCTVSGTSVEFEAASFNGSTNNAYCVPYQIIGIKL